MLGPIALGQGTWLSPEEHGPSTCHHAKFGSFWVKLHARMNGNLSEKNEPQRISFQGESMSSELTWINQIPVTSY